MSSILTNNSAMNALSTLRNINNSLDNTQNRISTGLKVNSAKDNSAYFSISTTMSGDSGMTKAINESLTLAKNSIATARLGAEGVMELAKQFTERLGFAHGAANDSETAKNVEKELQDITSRMSTIIDQSTFNGKSLVKAATEETVTTGITRDAAGAVTTTNFKFNQQNLSNIQSTLKGIADNIFSGGSATGVTDTQLGAAETQLDAAITAANAFGVAEKSVETQQEFLSKLSNNIDAGIGSMVDANMEEEAARLQALQVQQQLATQSLSMANQKPQNILSLFR